MPSAHDHREGEPRGAPRSRRTAHYCAADSSAAKLDCTSAEEWRRQDPDLATAREHGVHTGPFYDDSLSLTLLKRGTSSSWDDTDVDGVVDPGEWFLDIMVGSNGNTDDDNQPAAADTAACRVTRESFDGLAGSPWSNEVFFWGGYSTHQDAGTGAWYEYGGVCALDLTTGMISPVVSPSTSTRLFEYQFADVAPSPNVSDLLLVTGRQTPGTLVECREPVGSGPLSGAVCPDATPPLLVTRDSAGVWKPTPLLDVPASDAGLSVAWDTAGYGTLYLSTEHSGAWKGAVSW